jgi:hypothetical protein
VAYFRAPIWIGHAHSFATGVLYPENLKDALCHLLSHQMVRFDGMVGLGVGVGPFG